MVQQLIAGEPIRVAAQSAGDIHSRGIGAISPLKVALRCVACFTPKRTVTALRHPSERVSGALRDQVSPEGAIVEGFHEWPKVGDRHEIDGVLYVLVEISDRWVWDREPSQTKRNPET